MTIALYMDHHVKSAIADGLRRIGVDVVTCLEDGTDQATDERILQRATELGRVVFTQDAISSPSRTNGWGVIVTSPASSTPTN